MDELNICDRADEDVGEEEGDAAEYRGEIAKGQEETTEHPAESRDGEVVSPSSEG